MFRTLWRTMSTEVLAVLLLTVIAVLLGSVGVKTAPRAAVCIGGIVLLIVIYRLRYARR
jgi:uncharacterized membrane protein YjjP (DUF1212 family)